MTQTSNTTNLKENWQSIKKPAANPKGNWQGIKKPAEQSPIGGIILLHGLGASAADLAPGLSILSMPNKERISFCIPQAPIQPVTLNGGMKMPSWFDILALEDAQPQEDKVGLERSLQLIRQLVDELIADGVPENKIIVGGFSQGGALAMYSLFNATKLFAGAFSWSSYLPRGEAIPNNGGTPVLVTHGTLDAVIPHQAVSTMPKLLEDAGFNVQSHVFDELAHTIDRRVLDVWIRWLGEIF